MSDQEKTRIMSIVGLGPGTQLNGLFEIDEKIASGGMGEVFRGHEIMSGHPIAIKIVLSELAKDETIVGLFNKEARILRDFNHPAIVRYMAFGTDPIIGRPYLVMEFINGPSLAERLENGPLALEEAKNLFGRLASGLDAAHELGVIHRDISSDNVILAGGTVANAKIIDFGIARTTKGVTLLEGKFAGKYNFVSPEQLGLFDSNISEATDLYSFGLVMVNALRGKPIDMNGTQVEIIEKRRTVPDLSDIDESMRPIIELMLQPNPADRKVTMADIADWFTQRRERSSPPRPIPTAPPLVAIGSAEASKAVAIPLKEPTPVSEASRLLDQDAGKPADEGGDDFGKDKAPADETPEPAALVPQSGEVGDSGPGAGRMIESDSEMFESGRTGVDSPTGSDEDQKGSEPDEAQAPADGSAAEAEVVTGSSIPASDMVSGPDGGARSAGKSSDPDIDALLKPLMALKDADSMGSSESQAADEAAADHDPLPLTPRGADITRSAAPPGMAVSTGSQKARRSGKAGVLIAGLLVVGGALGGAYWYVSKNQNSEMRAVQPSVLTPTVAKGDTDTDGAQDVALLTPPVVPEPPRETEAPTAPATPEPASIDQESISGELGEIGARLAWVQDYDGGDCFFARGTAAGTKEIRIEGIGVNNDSFFALERDFTDRFGFEPGIEVRPIVERQCGITGFLSGMAVADLPTVRMELNSDRLKSGDSLLGKLSGLTKPNTVLYLVDNDGFVYQIDQFLKRNGDQGTFNIKLVELATRDPLPQVVIALSSETPIRGSALERPATVATFMPKLLEAIRSDGVELDYAFSFFLLGGT